MIGSFDMPMDEGDPLGLEVTASLCRLAGIPDKVTLYDLGHRLQELIHLEAALAAERAKVERLKVAINEIRAISQANDFKTFTEIAKDALKECQ